MSKITAQISKYKLLVYSLLLIGIGIFAFYYSFTLGVYGDEWQMLWMSKSAWETQRILVPQVSWNAYGFEMIVFNGISNLFGYQGSVYYIFSFICRLIATFVFFWFLIRRGLSVGSSFIGAVFLMVSPIGIEATNWARNFDSYLGIALLLVIVDAILRFKNTFHYLKFVLFFILLILVNPLRSHGNVLVILFLLLGKLIVSKEKKGLIVAAVSAILLFFLLIKLNILGGPISSSYFDSEFLNLTTVKSFLGNIGNSLVFKSNFMLVNFGIICLMWFYLKKELYLNSGFLGKVALIFYSVFFIIVASRIIYLPESFSVAILLGAFFMVLFLSTALLELKKGVFDDFLMSLFIIGLSSFYMIIPATRQPQFHASFEHRYLIYASGVIPIITAFFIASIFEKKKRFSKQIAGVGLAVLFGLFLTTSIGYLRSQSLTHNEFYSSALWDNLTAQFADYDFKSKRAGFIFLSDGESSSKVGDSVNFGFGYHMGLINKIWNEKDLPFIIVDDKKGIESLITDGKTSKKYLGKEEPFPKENILIYKITGTKVDRIKLEDYLNQI